MSALRASAIAAGILLFFVIAGEAVLAAMGVPVLAFQIAGEIVLFLFAPDNDLWRKQAGVRSGRRKHHRCRSRYDSPLLHSLRKK